MSNLDINAQTPGAAVFNTLPSDVQQAIISASVTVGPVATNLGPAAEMARGIVSGRTPSEAQIMGAMTGIATLAGGPIAGGAMAAIGAGMSIFETGLKGLFSALGFYKDPPPTFVYQGLHRVHTDQVPYGPKDTNNWIQIDNYADFRKIIYNNDSPGAKGMPGGRPHYSPNLAAQQNDFWQTAAIQFLDNITFILMPPKERWQWQNGSTKNPSSDDLVSTNEVRTSYKLLTPFETYFAHLLLKDLNFWANDWPFIPPQKLLSAAVHVWNSTHEASSTQEYGPYEGDNFISGPYHSTNFISWVLSGYGDSNGGMQAQAPITINTGAVIKPTVKVSLKGLKAMADAQKTIKLHLDPKAIQALAKNAKKTHPVAPILVPAISAALAAPFIGLPLAIGLGAAAAFTWWRHEEKT